MCVICLNLIPLFKHLEQTQILPSFSLVEGHLLCSLHNQAKKTNFYKRISDISEESDYKILCFINDFKLIQGYICC